ncbi:MAG: hypothetical protein R2786_03025 [Flavobacteriaceae bacterium]
MRVKFKSIVYGILGLLFSIGGSIGLINPKQNATATNEQIAQDLIHTTMELGAAILPIGFLLIWSALNPKKVQKLNYFFILFFLLFASIHWYEYLLGNRQIESPLLNSIPLILIIIVFAFNTKST